MIAPPVRPLLALVVALAATSTALAQQPNFLVIVADDLGCDRVAAYAEHPDPGHTPVIDSLAADGVLFRTCWSNTSCSPSRAAMLTGRYCKRTGFAGTDFYSTPFELDPAELTIPEALGSGYESVAVGKWHLGSRYMSGIEHPLVQGFQHFRGTTTLISGNFIDNAYYNWQKVVDDDITWSTTYHTTDAVDDALEFIDGFTGPWFLWLSFHAPHAPFHKPPQALHTYNLPANIQANVPIHVKAMIEAMDTEIGRLLSSMDPAVRDNTVIVFIGDNGTDKVATTAPWNPNHAKGSLYEGGIRVPLIISGPGIAQGVECNALVQATDLFATMTELAGLSVPAPEDSVSLVPYLTNPSQPSLRTHLYSDLFKPCGFGPYNFRKRAVRTAQYKLIELYDDPTFTTTRELYNLQADPFETNNLLAGTLDAQQQAAYDDLSLQLFEPYVPWLDVARALDGTNGEPLLDGFGAVTSTAPFHRNLTRARPDSLAVLVLGLQNLSLWFNTGVFVPSPDHLFYLVTSPSGAVTVNGTWPPGIPPGESVIFQYWIQDPVAPYGWAGTKGLAANFQ